MRGETGPGRGRGVRNGAVGGPSRHKKSRARREGRRRPPRGATALLGARRAEGTGQEQPRAGEPLVGVAGWGRPPGESRHGLWEDHKGGHPRAPETFHFTATDHSWDTLSLSPAASAGFSPGAADRIFHLPPNHSLSQYQRERAAREAIHAPLVPIPNTEIAGGPGRPRPGMRLVEALPSEFVRS